MVIVRGDLSTGQKVAQAIHATGESTPFRVPKNTIAVALRTVAEDAGATPELLALQANLEKAGIAHVLIAECDGEPMAIGIEPTRDRHKLRRWTSHLPLIK